MKEEGLVACSQAFFVYSDGVVSDRQLPGHMVETPYRCVDASYGAFPASVDCETIALLILSPLILLPRFLNQ